MTVPSRFAISKTEPGNPTIHTLKVIETKRVEENKIRKLVINSDGCIDTTEYGSKVILLVGETGSGKTLMINAMLNYVLGVKWGYSYRYKLDPDEDESKKRSHAQSQTEWISAYTLHHHEGFKIPYSITIIDTPGFGDTVGIPKDKKITDQIKFLFNENSKECVDQIDAVIFVVQSDKPRLTPSQMFVFDCLLSLFGKDIKDNIFLFTTFADHNVPLVLEGMKQADVPYTAYYKFNNSPLYSQKKSKGATKEESSDNESSDDESSDDEIEVYNEMFWKSGAKQFKNFFIQLGITSSKSTWLSFEVLREREALNARIKVIPQLIRSKLVTLERLNKEEEMLTASQNEKNKHRDFTFTVAKEITSQKTLSNGEYAMTCRNCEVNCHYPCSPYLKFLCSAFYFFSGCSVCPKKCSKRDHDNKNFIYETTVIFEEKTYDDVKARYDNACKKSMSHKELVEKVSQEAENIRDELSKHVSEVRRIFKRLDEIALKKNPTSTANYLQYLIKTEKASGELGWEDRVIQLEQLLSEAKVQDKLAKGVGYSEIESSLWVGGAVNQCE